MKKIISLLVVLGLATAAFAGGKKDKPVVPGSTNSAADAEISARGAIGGMESALQGPLFEGKGGEGIRLVVLPPHGQTAAEDSWLPVYVQGMLNNNFKKYSRLTLIDRQNLNRVLEEQGLSMNGSYSDQDQIQIGHLTNAQYILAGGVQKIPANLYSVQLSITDIKTGESAATFMKNGTVAQLQNGTLINEATEDLLSQIGVRLTAAGRQALSEGRTAMVKAETGLAKGIAAQAAGASVEALLNYSQSIAFDPSQMEALSRLNILSSEIRGGSITAQIVGDIQARRSWLAAFKEAATFFNDHPPFEITFDPSLIQEGKTDYVNERADLAMRVALKPADAGFEALNALVRGLDKTGKREAWGFKGWPLLDIEPKTPEAVVFGGKREFNFKVDVALVNEKKKVIANSSINLSAGSIPYNAGDSVIKPPVGDANLVRFPKVNANDLTPTITIVITGVNGITSKKLSDSGYIKIVAGGLEEKTRAIEEARKAAGTANFVLVQGGTFQMGGNQVTISKSFYLGKYEVTQKEWVEVMGSTPSNWKEDNLPVERVSWNEVIDYCNKRSVKEGLTPAYTVNGSSVTWNKNASGYRLPTEAEWEWAARGGGKSSGYEYAGSSNAGDAGWYGDNSGSKTHPVGTKKANELGIYDMSGNVWEWCWDWYGSYSSGSQTDPTGAYSGSNRV